MRTRRPAEFLSLCLLVASLGGCAWIGTGERAPSRVEGRLDLAADAQNPPASLLPVVIYLDSDAPPPRPPAPPPAVRVQHDGERFGPVLAVLGRGARLEIQNESEVHHRLFWLDTALRHSLSIPPGPGFSVQIELLEGVARIYCELHPEEHFTVFVAPSHLFSVLDAPGPFAIDAVPPGAWRLHLWSDGFEGEVREIEVLASETHFEEVRLGRGLLR